MLLRSLIQHRQYRWRFDVTIKEEDGSEQRFTQPYASLAILKREGQTDVDVSVGELRDEDGFTPDVLQAQILHGFPRDHFIWRYAGC